MDEVVDVVVCVCVYVLYVLLITTGVSLLLITELVKLSNELEERRKQLLITCSRKDKRSKL